MPEKEPLSIVWNKMVASILQQPITLVFFFVITAYWIFQTIKNYQKNQSGSKLFVDAVIIFFSVVVIPVLFILLTEFLALRSVEYGFFPTLDSSVIANILRWITLYFTLCPLVLAITYKYSKFKSTLIAFTHLSIILAGWVAARWMGILSISLPVLVIFHSIAYSLAQIIYPAATPEDKNERNNKFWALVWYIWGLQYPIWGPKDITGRGVEIKIPGNNIKTLGKPGILWTHSYQVAGTSYGVEFSRVVGPGTIFLGRLEKPTYIVDLRTQIRTVVNLGALTKNGVPIQCVLFMSFKIDATSWKELDRKDEIHPLVRKAPVLHYGLESDSNLNGSYPYSKARIQAALGVSGIDTTSSNKNVASSVFWDEISVQRISEIARIVISERTLNELWLPRDDSRGSSALDEIATDIVKRAKPRLREIGVELFAARVVNYVIPEKDPVREQLIASWLAIFNQRIESIKLDGETDAEILRVRARSSAKDAFLQAITNRLRQARGMNPNFPKQVIALNFISTLQQILETQDADSLNQQLQTLTFRFGHFKPRMRNLSKLSE